MKKPRNKTVNRRLHYLGVMAAAGLITSGAVPGWAQQTIDPQSTGTFNGGTGDVTIEGLTNNSVGQNATVTWADTDIDGGLIFGDMADSQSDPVGINLAVGIDGTVTGVITNTGNNSGANIIFSGASGLQAGGLAGGANGITITNDASNTVTVSGDLNGNVTLAGDGAYHLTTIGGTAGEQTVLDLNGTGPTVDAAAIGNSAGSTTVNITNGLFGQTTAPEVSGQVGINLNGAGAQAANVAQINDGSTLSVGGTNTDGTLMIGTIEGGPVKTPPSISTAKSGLNSTAAPPGILAAKSRLISTAPRPRTLRPVI